LEATGLKIAPSSFSICQTNGCRAKVMIEFAQSGTQEAPGRRLSISLSLKTDYHHRAKAGGVLWHIFRGNSASTYKVLVPVNYANEDSHAKIQSVFPKYLSNWAFSLCALFL
jgi:hypothetical protein